MSRTCPSVGRCGRSATRKRGEIAIGTILAWILVGGVAGWLASRVVQGTGLGLVGDIVVGVLGAFIGGLLLSLLLPGTFGVTGFNLSSIVIAFLGAAALLLVVRRGAVIGR
jgi:uncharacterized membrane protein YeaQ/YmgE (transglycosylase-associated protein family)